MTQQQNVSRNIYISLTFVRIKMSHYRPYEKIRKKQNKARPFMILLNGNITWENKTTIVSISSQGTLQTFMCM